MLTSSLYYSLRPLIPRRMQILLRRVCIRGRVRWARGRWPILESAGERPPDWPGWPDGKRFALVLTHDVESREGLARVRRVMDMEEELGFRSSFNLVPRRYETPPELRREIAGRGFEVGVHGLYHDGKLFRSHRIFSERATAINRYLADWGADGFRSPSMHHNLDWIRELRIRYDTSTFDTDPFEPQPSGVGTIFPFIVRAGGGDDGYVELPYTLPQDFTLFCLLRDAAIDTWKRKLAWIAEKGGMALVNTHPDYMSFTGDANRPWLYRAALYRDLLDHVRGTYGDACWLALPRDVAAFCRRTQGIPVRHPRRLRCCMLSYSFYESDNRVMRYAESLARRGDEVDVIALRHTGQPKRSVCAGVNVYSIQTRERDEKGKWSYIARVLRFLVHSSATVGAFALRNRYDLVHVHSMPDFEVFAAWLPKLLGAKVILDIHDLVPELYANKFGINPASATFRFLTLVERASTAFAHHVIIANHIWGEKLTQRSVPAAKCSVFINYVDPRVFAPRTRTRRDGRFIMIYPGSLQWHQGLDIAIRALAIVRDGLPRAELHIYGGGSELPELRKLAEDCGLSERVRFNSEVALRDVPELMAQADLGIVPKRADGFGNEAFSTKILEFMSQGLPVVASRTKVDQWYFSDDEIRFFDPGSHESMAGAILDVGTDRALYDRLAAGSRQCWRKHSWADREADYLALVDGLAGSPAARTER